MVMRVPLMHQLSTLSTLACLPLSLVLYHLIPPCCPKGFLFPKCARSCQSRDARQGGTWFVLGLRLSELARCCNRGTEGARICQCWVSSCNVSRGFSSFLSHEAKLSYMPKHLNVVAGPFKKSLASWWGFPRSLKHWHLGDQLIENCIWGASWNWPRPPDYWIHVEARFLRWTILVHSGANREPDVCTCTIVSFYFCCRPNCCFSRMCADSRIAENVDVKSWTRFWTLKEKSIGVMRLTSLLSDGAGCKVRLSTQWIGVCF